MEGNFIGDPIVIDLEKARKRLEKDPVEIKDLPSDAKQRVLRCASRIDKVLKEEQSQLQIDPQLQLIGSGIFKIGGAFVIKAIPSVKE